MIDYPAMLNAADTTEPMNALSPSSVRDVLAALLDVPAKTPVYALTPPGGHYGDQEDTDPRLLVSINDEVGSYRGYYEDLYIAYGNVAEEPVTARDLAKTLTRQVGKTVRGYKGGEYLITDDTNTWLSTYGDTGGMMIDRIVTVGDALVIITEREQC